jgi:hypothetical protein
LKPGMVAHVYIPSYSGGIGRRTMVRFLSWADQETLCEK